MLTGRTPLSDELSLRSWKKIIDIFPVRVREVVISGGEPFLFSVLPRLVNYLIEKKYFVTIQTNLTLTKQVYEINASSRLLISATYHSPMRIAQFEENLNEFRALGHRVIVTNPEQSEVETHRKTEIYDIDQAGEMCFDIPRLVIAPNGHLFYNFRSMFLSLSGLKPFPTHLKKQILGDKNDN
jgi:hypothetical protein